jgi:hypothetical protein
MDNFFYWRRLEETIHLISDGKKYRQMVGILETPKIRQYNLELQERMEEEAEIVKSNLDIHPNYYHLTDLKLIPLQDRWTISEKICEKQGKIISYTITEYIQDTSVAFEKNTGGIEIIPGILVFDTDLPIASETGMEGIYSVDTEKDNKGNWLNRPTVHINIKDGHTIAHQVRGDRVEVIYEGDLGKALEGGLWIPGKYPFPATEKVYNIINNFPKQLGKPEGLQPLLDALY